MTKVLYLLTIVAMVVTAIISYQNKRSGADMRADRAKTNNQISAELNNFKKAAKEVAEVEAQQKVVAEDLAQGEERANQAKITLKNAIGANDRYNQDIKEKQDRKKDLDSQLADLKKTLPEGMGIDNLQEHINQVKTTIANNQKTAEDAATATKAKQDELKKAQEQLEDVAKKIEERKRLFDRNSLTASIVAVNNDWGFVVINAGENQKITPDTKLLVTRGEKTVGKLNIVSVEGNKTIANIVQKSLQSGTTIAPGDKVILEILMQ